MESAQPGHIQFHHANASEDDANAANAAEPCITRIHWFNGHNLLFFSVFTLCLDEMKIYDSAFSNPALSGSFQHI